MVKSTKINMDLLKVVETIDSILDMLEQGYPGRLLIQLHTTVYLPSLKTMESVVMF